MGVHLIDNVEASSYTDPVRLGWDEEKNKQLKRLGRPSFEQVAEALALGELIADLENPSSAYEGQFVLIVKIKNYVHYVPYHDLPNGIRFLITVIPSRKLNKKYGG